MKKFFLGITLILALAFTPKAHAFPVGCSGSWYGWIYMSPAGQVSYWENCTGENGADDWFRVSWWEFESNVLIDNMPILDSPL